jgi:hypothetical protein
MAHSQIYCGVVMGRYAFSISIRYSIFWQQISRYSISMFTETALIKLQTLLTVLSDNNVSNSNRKMNSLVECIVFRSMMHLTYVEMSTYVVINVLLIQSSNRRN